MDDNSFRKKCRVLPIEHISLALICASFALGAAMLALLRLPVYEMVMSIGAAVPAVLILASAAVLCAESLCMIMPAPRTTVLVFSCAGGFLCAFIAYRCPSENILSGEFLLCASAIFTYIFALVYISVRSFVLSPRLRQLIRSDRRLHSELAGFFAAAAVLVIFALFIGVKAFCLPSDI